MLELMAVQYAVVTPAYLAVILLEALYLRWVRGEAYPRAATRASLAVGTGYLLNIFAMHALMAPAYLWVHAHRLFDLPVDRPARGLALFVGMELAFYWYHRLAHTVRGLWVSHSVHHSSPAMNFAAALRLPWNGEIYSAATLLLPLIWLGFSPTAVLAAVNFNLFYQFWTHTRLGGPMALWGLVFNTPSHHRVHHARNPEYLDKNFGSVLIVFDRLFGTFAAERPELPCVYGLVGGNDAEVRPWRLALGPVVSILRELRAAPTWRARLALALMPPGWRHDGPSATSAALRAALPPARPAPQPSATRLAT